MLPDHPAGLHQMRKIVKVGVLQLELSVEVDVRHIILGRQCLRRMLVLGRGIVEAPPDQITVVGQLQQDRVKAALPAVDEELLEHGEVEIQIALEHRVAPLVPILTIFSF